MRVPPKGREMAAEVAAHLHAGARIQRGRWFVEQKPLR
jgi:hypothetical protein